MHRNTQHFVHTSLAKPEAKVNFKATSLMSQPVRNSNGLLTHLLENAVILMSVAGRHAFTNQLNLDLVDIIFLNYILVDGKPPWLGISVVTKKTSKTAY